ncbi:MAG: hypothetical protein BROFUL_01511 [Candidatus Brocadia fulgida]|uniref:Uncharacterized protein n=1 Tax=Candidatus Brocadia fulgida TaxID=380242 RepID=A0A0M2UZ86_9BACT|nr:MAG: hypothetical protein BROFUL_01511 [Candidatus Brocadia fulgida]
MQQLYDIAICLSIGLKGNANKKEGRQNVGDRKRAEGHTSKIRINRR